MLGDGRGAAVWAPPGAAMPRRETLRLAPRLVRAWGVRRFAANVRAWSAVEHTRPGQPPHWYLYILGVHPDVQGRGLGSALMRPVLDRCDAEGVPAAATVYTSTVVRWLQRSGFAVTHSTRTAVDHELPIWTLVRQPRRG